MNFAIIAAGEGSRLVQEGVATPKPLVLLDGKPMIQRLCDIFADCNARSISIIVNEQMSEVQAFVRRLQASMHVPVMLTVKTTPSSMHSFYEVSRNFPSGSKFIVTTVDTIFRPDDFKRYVQAFENAGNVDGCFAVTPFIDDEKPLYVDVDADMTITGFRDNASDADRYVSGGIYGLTSPCLEVLAECINLGVSRMRNYQRALIAAGMDIKAFPLPKIVDVDHAADIATAQAFLNEK